jgi:hypothetical protein
MEGIIFVAIAIVVAILIMICTNILYDLFAAIMPVLGLLIVVIGIIVGFFIAIKNTVISYKQVYGKKVK